MSNGMPGRLHIIFLTAVLTLLGLGLCWYKVTNLGFPLTPDAKYQSWYVEASFNIVPDKPGQPLRMEFWLPPQTSDQLATIDMAVIADGFGQRRKRSRSSGNRWLELTKRETEPLETVLFRATLYQLDSAATELNTTPPEADQTYTAENRYLLARPANDPLFLAIDKLLAEAYQKSADPASFLEEVARLAALRDDRTKIILKSVEGVTDTPALTSFLLNTAGIPARLVHGVKLVKERRDAALITWPEVWQPQQGWQYLNPNADEALLQQRPKRLLPWWVGNAPFYTEEGARLIDSSVSIKRNDDNSITRSYWTAKGLSIPTLHSLPIGTQLIMQVLLLIPIGGLVIAFLRQIIGLVTFGTFMPVLIALAFRETGLLAGLFFFSLVVGLGLIVRGYFNTLQLLLVPRLASVLTVTVLILIAITLAMQSYGITVGLSISLFPIVILAMTIERMALLWDEYGPQKALLTGLGSLLASVIGYFAMNWPLAGHLVFTFPELLLVVLAITILLGRYNGYKLTEYWRFKALAKEAANNADS